MMAGKKFHVCILVGILLAVVIYNTEAKPNNPRGQGQPKHDERDEHKVSKQPPGQARAEQVRNNHSHKPHSGENSGESTRPADSHEHGSKPPRHHGPSSVAPE